MFARTQLIQLFVRTIFLFLRDARVGQRPDVSPWAPPCSPRSLWERAAAWWGRGQRSLGITLSPHVFTALRGAGRVAAFVLPQITNSQIFRAVIQIRFNTIPDLRRSGRGRFSKGDLGDSCVLISCTTHPWSTLSTAGWSNILKTNKEIHCDFEKQSHFFTASIANSPPSIPSFLTKQHTVF